MQDDQGNTDTGDLNRHEAHRRILEFVASFSLISPHDKADPAIVSRIREIVDHIPDATLTGLLANIARADGGARPTIEAFCAAHGISRAEARLLSSLVGGGSVGEHAMQAGISINTARTHMRRLLEKTSATSQADLVRRYFSG